MSIRRKSVATRVVLATALAASVAWAAPTYDPGTASSAGLTFGTMQFGAAAHPSVAGNRQDGGINANSFDTTGDVLDASGDAGRVFMYDAFAHDALVAGQSNRGDTNFAMMIWDFGQAVNFVRMYLM